MEREAVRKTRARRGEGDLLRDEIIEATRQLLVETGDANAITVRMISDRVGVTPPSIYMHFPSKADVIYECCGVLFEEFTGHLERAVEGLEGPLDRLVAMGRAYVHFGLEHPELYRILFMTVPSEQPEGYDVQEMLQKGGFMALVAVVTELITIGRISSDDPIKISLGLWALAHGVTSLMIAHHHVPWPEVEEMIDHQIGAYLHGLTATA
jgi:AcrR family transcriptional regulator